MNRRTIRLRLQRLDDRVLPATYGVPWGDSRHLTMSLAPDGAPIAGHASDLFATLDAQMPRTIWRTQLLRAMQSWVSLTNLSVGVIGDSGLPFGTPGLGQGDPRFGDIRLGGQLMDQSVLSISVPHDPFLSGTWSGDVLLNSSFNFTQLQTDLYSIALHEFGHVFGLPHSADPTSVMFSHGARTYSGLSPSDVLAIRNLYGVRVPDGNDGSNGNDTMGRATRIRTEDPTIPGIAFGDITTSQDVDFYRIDVPINYVGPASIRVVSAGISQLAFRMTVYNEAGTVLSQTNSVDPAGGAAAMTLMRAVPGQKYFIRVEGDQSDIFGIGRYGVAVSLFGFSNVDRGAIDRVLRGPYDNLSPSELEKLFRPEVDPLLNDDDGGDDDPINAVRLEASHSSVAVTHFGMLASLDSPTDVDYYRVAVELGGTQASVVTATTSGLLGTTIPPRIELLDHNLAPLPYQVLANGNGTYTVQATGLDDNEDIYLRVAVNPGSTALTANYGLNVDIGGQAATLQTFSAATFTGTATAAQQTLYVARPQLFQFLLTSSAGGASLGAQIQATITNEHGAVVMNLVGRIGEPTSGPSVLLAPGPYTISYRIKALPGSPPVSFALRGMSLSDPIGPVRNDTTLTPRYVDPNNPNSYIYPNGVHTQDEYIWTGIVFI